ncbi:extensin family protein [Paracoccus sp. 11-3]|uniref:Extensin family protein n=1 Tax=Paracoccus amoyensis TaxID=2760093 RepID=A0A926GFK8_9RHOB|nr:extensin family protein [Paracoccus amoyensis]MBC9246419.1 extensin family protein [Paracoccus amoyensis]
MNWAASTLIVTLGCLWLSAAHAQERPASAPRSDDEWSQGSPVVDADARPPEKPATQDAANPEGSPEGGDGDTSSAVDEKVLADKPAAPLEQTFGPPPPPLWYLQRETDQEYAACKLALSFLGTIYHEEDQQNDADNPECGIARPIRVDRILPDLTLEGGALMRCDTARALGLWAHQFLRPASAALPDAPRVTSLQLGTTYDCRGRVGTEKTTPKLSEHAYGNAIDIMAFVFDNGETLRVEPRVDTGQMTEAFQKAVRHAGCLYFSTVLGPGSNAAHDNHLHFDVAVRKGGWRLCE